MSPCLAPGLHLGCFCFTCKQCPEERGSASHRKVQGFLSVPASWRLDKSAQAAIAECHRLGAFFSHSSRDKKSRFKVQQGQSVSDEVPPSPLPGLHIYMAISSLKCQVPFPCACTSSSYKDPVLLD